MMNNRLLLPENNWNRLLSALEQLGTTPTGKLSVKSGEFLEQLGYIDEECDLTPSGKELARLLLVRGDREAVDMMTHLAVYNLPATQAVLQALVGMERPNTYQVKMALVFAGLTLDEASSGLTNFLDVLNANGIIKYNRRDRSIRILVSPKASSAPSHVYIDRTRPYSNDVWAREILRECKGSILWIDKYFQKEAFEWLWREADASKIKSIRIVSARSKSEIDSVTRSDYQRLKKELLHIGITLNWRAIEFTQGHDLHDRWILDDENLCFNVPSVNSIKSGQKSELHRSPNHKALHEAFNNYYDTAKEI